MATTLNQVEVASIAQFMEFVERQNAVRWYRGCGDSSYKLQPSLYRHPTLTDAQALLNQEVELIKRFRQRSIPHLAAPLGTDDLDVLFLMQHFGVPTRLLDWSENPYIALYFALTTAKRDSTGAVTSDAVIWVLDPENWNSKAVPFNPPVGIISPPNDDLLNGYLPAKNTTYRKEEAVALYGAYNSPRIVAQRGTFCLFGASTKPMEETYIDNGYPQDCLVKVLIRAANIETLLSGLIRIGITDSVVYPDLGGLAIELKRQFGYRV